MRNTQHFIITRFNVAIDGRPVDREGKPVMTLEWMHYRLGLFERFCLPSVRAQTDLEFTWLVRYDEQTPVEILTRLLEHERAFPNLVLVPSRRWFRMSLAKRLRRGTTRLLTTRLDSDDALHRDAIAVVRANAREVPGPEFLNLLHGYCYEYASGAVARIEEPSTFLTLVEPVGGSLPKAVTYVNHRRAAELAPVRQIEHEPPLWLRVIHARNLSNRMYGVRCDGADLEPFGFDRR